MLGQILLTSFHAICPLLLLMVLGFVLKRAKFLTSEFDQIGNKLVFKVCLPTMIFLNIYTIDDLGAMPWNLVWYCMAALLLLFLLGILITMLTTPVPQRRGVILQCVFRSNFSIIGIPLAMILDGQKAANIASVVMAFSIPLCNLLAVLSLSMFLRDGDGKKNNFKKLISNIITNPLLIATALAFMCHGLRLLQTQLWGEQVFRLDRDAQFLHTALTFLSNSTTPLALLVMGSQFVFKAVKELKREIIVATFCRLVLSPLLGVGGAWLLSTYTDWLTLTSVEYPALICLFGTPVAVSSAIMASGMKNDGQLATQLVVWTSALSMLTLFGFFCIMMSMGLLNVA